MRPRICMCCGEPMAEGANALSRNPNVCASCSSLADGLEEANLPIEDARVLGAVAEAVPQTAVPSPMLPGVPKRCHAPAGEFH